MHYFCIIFFKVSAAMPHSSFLQRLNPTTRSPPILKFWINHYS